MFCGAHGHIRELKKQAGEALIKTIEWRELTLLPTSLSYFVRLIREINIIQTLLQILPEGESSQFLVTHARPATLVALKFLKTLAI